MRTITQPPELEELGVTVHYEVWYRFLANSTQHGVKKRYGSIKDQPSKEAAVVLAQRQNDARADHNVDQYEFYVAKVTVEAVT